jgi:hypothetical protein
MADHAGHLRHRVRFREIGGERYPSRVADAYDGDLERAATDTNEQVRERVAAWERAHGLPVADWRSLGAVHAPLTAHDVVELARVRGLHLICYADRVGVRADTRDENIANEFRALGAALTAYAPEAHANPQLRAWEIALHRIPCEGDVYAAVHAADEWSAPAAA